MLLRCSNLNGIAVPTDAMQDAPFRELCSLRYPSQWSARLRGRVCHLENRESTWDNGNAAKSDLFCGSTVGNAGCKQKRCMKTGRNIRQKFHSVKIRRYKTVQHEIGRLQVAETKGMYMVELVGIEKLGALKTRELLNRRRSYNVQIA